MEEIVFGCNIFKKKIDRDDLSDNLKHIVFR